MRTRRSDPTPVEADPFSTFMQHLIADFPAPRPLGIQPIIAGLLPSMIMIVSDPNSACRTSLMLRGPRVTSEVRASASCRQVVTLAG